MDGLLDGHVGSTWVLNGRHMGIKLRSHGYQMGVTWVSNWGHMDIKWGSHIYKLGVTWVSSAYGVTWISNGHRIDSNNCRCI